MKKAYSEGTLLMLSETLARIGCGPSRPKDHVSDWLQQRFSLEPAGRIRIPGHKGTHLVWRERDVERAKVMWAARPIVQTVAMGPSNGVHDLIGEIEAMEKPTPGWMPSDRSPMACLKMIEAATVLLGNAADLMKKGA